MPMRDLARNVVNLLCRGTVTLANATGNLQTLQLALLADENKDDVEHFEPYGFTSNPLPGAEVLAAFVEGDRSHGIVVVAADRRYRVVGLTPGDVALYNDQGVEIKLSGNTVSVSGATAVTVTGGDVTADGISLKNHYHTYSGGNTSAAVG